MKKIALSIICLLVILSTSAFCGGISLRPRTSTVCYGETIYVQVAGQSFNPISYVWSDGSTGSSTTAYVSGLYTVTATGFLGNSSNIVTTVESRFYSVLPKPTIQATTPLWVCKQDTVNLQVSGSYQTYSWNNGSSDTSYQKVFNQQVSGPVLDTASVWYTASYSFANYSCTANSDTVLLRAIRRPEALTPKYCGATNLKLTDSVKTGLVLSYLYPTGYEVEFTDVANPGNVSSYLTSPGSRMISLSGLQVGTTYSVRTRAVINGVSYCWGPTCTITITSVNRFDSPVETDDFTVKHFQVFDMNGRFLLDQSGTRFNHEWLRGLPPQIYAVVTIQDGIAVDKKLIAPTSSGNW